MQFLRKELLSKFVFLSTLTLILFSLNSSQASAALTDGTNELAISAVTQFKTYINSNFSVTNVMSDNFYETGNNFHNYSYVFDYEVPGLGNNSGYVYFTIGNYLFTPAEEGDKQAFGDEVKTTVLGLEAVTEERGPDIDTYDSSDPDSWDGYYSKTVSAWCGMYKIYVSASLSIYGNSVSETGLRNVDSIINKGLEIGKITLCDGATSTETVKLTGKIIHIDGTPFEGAEIRVKTDKDVYENIKTDSNGVYSVEIAKDSTNVRVSANKEGYLAAAVSSIKSPYTVEDLLLATPEEYENEVKSALASLLKAANVSEADANKIASKLSFDYESYPDFQYKWNVMYLSNTIGENFWQSPDWETVAHELGHHVMRHLAYDIFSDILGEDHSLGEPTNNDTAYDEARAHMFAMIFLNYAENQDSLVIKNSSTKTWNYDYKTLETKYPKNKMTEIEGLVTQFWIGYYGESQIQNSPAKVLNDILGTQAKFYYANWREIRNITEWINTKKEYIWLNSDKTDRMKLAYYNRLAYHSGLQGLIKEMPVFTVSPDAVWEFEYNTDTLKISKGFFNVSSGTLVSIKVGNNEIKPHSSFAIGISDNGDILMWLKEGLLELFTGDVKVGEIEPQDGYKKLSQGSILDLTSSEISLLGSVNAYSNEIPEEFLTESLDVVEANFDNMEGWGYQESFGSWIAIIIGGLLTIGSIPAWILLTKKSRKTVIKIMVVIAMVLVGLITIIVAWPYEIYYDGATAEINDSDETATNDDTDTAMVEDEYGTVTIEEIGATMNIGDFATRGYFVTDTTNSSGEADYTFCVATSETQKYSLCDDSGMISLFMITKISADQFDEFTESERLTVETSIDLGEYNGYVYLLSHPNGFFPEDVDVPEDFYDVVEESFIVSEAQG